MQTDSLKVAVRPRSIFECLDLAVLFCGRRPVAVVLATALGSLPWMLANRILFSGHLTDDGLYAAVVILAFEAAWAAVPLTLYLGQSMFSERFHWRSAARVALGGLPALVVFQGVFRFICLGTCIGAPLLIVAYYLNQIILLERPRFTRIWPRCNAVNRGRGWNLLTLAILDGILLILGTTLMISLVGTIARLWIGQKFATLTAFEREGLVASLFTWHGQIAFFATCGFLSVFRFFTYLDTRIRREGWDVELKFRAEGTYEGLPRVSSAAIPRLLVSILAGAAGVVGCEPVFAQASTGTSFAAAGLGLRLFAPGGAGLGEAEFSNQSTDADAARRAVTKQSFPWYDPSADAFRPVQSLKTGSGVTSPEAVPPSSRPADSAQAPLHDADRKPATAEEVVGNRDSSTSPPAVVPRERPGLAESGQFGAIVMFMLLLAAVVAFIVLIVRNGLGDRSREPAESRMPDSVASPEAVTQRLPLGIEPPEGDPLVKAAAAAERGDFATATMLFHAWMLAELDRQGGLTLRRGKTNGQYRVEVAGSAPDAADLFATSCRLFEGVFFGQLPVDQKTFSEVWDRRATITARTPAGMND